MTLIRNRLTRSHRFLRHPDQRLRSEHSVIGAIDPENNVISGCLGCSIGCLRLQSGTRHQTAGSAQVGDQLIDNDAFSFMAE